VELKDGKISVDYTGLPKFHLDLTQIPTRTIMMTAVTDQQIEMEIDYRDVRDAQVIYSLTQKLISIKYNDPKTGRMFQLFPQLKDIVEQWYETQIEILGGDGSPEQRRLILNWDINKVVANIYEGIRMAGSSSERISAILNYYNPEGSTAFVRGATTKSVYPTVKSHVNYVVADTDSWEQIAAKTLEELSEVQYYVKNHFLDFKIPYSDGSVEHDYMPDFIAVCKTKSGELVNLIIEISGFSNDRTGNKDIKRHYTHDYWLPAANNLEKYGRWDFIEIDDIMTIKATLIEKINTL
jgi:type III restriction enzyme